MKELKIRLRVLRKTRQLSQEQLAQELGVSRQAIIALEHGESLPSLPLLCSIIEFFETTFNDLLEEPFLQEVIKEGDNMSKDLTWIPMREVGSIHDLIDRVFDDQVASFQSRTVAIPAVDLHETDKEVIIDVHVPGIDQKDVDIEVQEEFVTIKGERKTENVDEDKQKNYLHREISYGSFIRQINLPTPVETDKAEAKMKNGVLTVTLPKLEPTKPKTKKIEIK